MPDLTPFVEERVRLNRALRHPEQPLPMNEVERLASVATGSALVVWGLFSRSALSLIGTLGGGYLIYRGAAGVCPFTDMLKCSASSSCASSRRGTATSRRGDEAPRGTNRPPHSSESITTGQPQSMSQMIDESSWESFPASDPPAHHVTSPRGYARPPGD